MSSSQEGSAAPAEEAPTPPSSAAPLEEGALPMTGMPMAMPTMPVAGGEGMQMPMMQMPMQTGGGAPMAFSFDPSQMQGLMQNLSSLPQGTGVVFAGQEPPSAAAPAEPAPTAAYARPAPPPRGASLPVVPKRGPAVSPRGPPPAVPARHKSQPAEQPFSDLAPEDDDDDLPPVEDFPEDEVIASDQVIKEGWLWKKAAKLNRWQKRYVRLYSTYVTYYEKLPSSAAIQPDGVFSLEGYVVGKVNQGDAYVIQLKHAKGGRDYQFQANTPWEVELWVVELQEVMEALPDRIAACLPTARPKMSETITAHSMRLKREAVKGSRQLTVRSKSKGTVGPRKHAHPVFCVPLDSIVQVDPETDIPIVVRDTIAYLESRVEIEGLFRLSGSAIAIAQLKERYDSGEEVDLSSIQDPHAVAGLLKLFFREAPVPLLTFELYEEFLAFPGLEDDVKLDTMRDLVSRLPERNGKVLRHVMLFLQRVAAKESINFMGTGNIAIVFGPNIMRRENATMIESMLESKSGNSVVKYMLDHVDDLFA
eukprot:CAMPEP_0114633438 /NCGR_PEP_ID=MMETSP0168-20121206/15455_1 /TAXON_ID=95228 ORGANISM="Vannella sp., Strain DIVA3 517/6/12" /NCGR_SAMPLE_ID=MMETSP0168 /ASSEMBLY_ACC=CAM_ASM_000044 /LENGTH=533 /DNA_ID=CAMNT_0001845089 /DNA_START=18 /DNA_END=1619 /DNA_ORIENTATION=-